MLFYKKTYNLNCILRLVFTSTIGYSNIDIGNSPVEHKQVANLKTLILLRNKLLTLYINGAPYC